MQKFSQLKKKNQIANGNDKCVCKLYFHQNVNKINECRENMNKSYQDGMKYVRLKHMMLKEICLAVVKIDSSNIRLWRNGWFTVVHDNFPYTICVIF